MRPRSARWFHSPRIPRVARRWMRSAPSSPARARRASPDVTPKPRRALGLVLRPPPRARLRAARRGGCSSFARENEVKRGDYELARQLLEATVWSGLAARDDQTAAEAAVRVVYLDGRRAEWDDGLLWAAHAEALAARTKDAMLEAHRLRNLGLLLSAKGEYGAAKDAMERALALHHRLLPAGDPRIASMASDLAGRGAEQGTHARGAPAADGRAGRASRRARRASPAGRLRVELARERLQRPRRVRARAGWLSAVRRAFRGVLRRGARVCGNGAPQRGLCAQQPRSQRGGEGGAGARGRAAQEGRSVPSIRASASR